MRLRVWLIAVLLFVAAGCGGSSGESGGTADGGSLESLWKRPGEDVAVIPGTSDYAPGDVRVSFLVVAGDGKVVQRPRARVWLAPSRTAAPIQEAEARLELVVWSLAYGSCLAGLIVLLRKRRRTELGRTELGRSVILRSLWASPRTARHGGPGTPGTRSSVNDSPARGPRGVAVPHPRKPHGHPSSSASCGNDLTGSTP